jgi:hypothetical protein
MQSALILAMTHLVLKKMSASKDGVKRREWEVFRQVRALRHLGEPLSARYTVS